MNIFHSFSYTFVPFPVTDLPPYPKTAQTPSTAKISLTQLFAKRISRYFAENCKGTAVDTSRQPVFRTASPHPKNVSPTAATDFILSPLLFPAGQNSGIPAFKRIGRQGLSCLVQAVFPHLSGFGLQQLHFRPVAGSKRLRFVLIFGIETSHLRYCRITVSQPYRQKILKYC